MPWWRKPKSVEPAPLEHFFHVSAGLVMMDGTICFVHIQDVSVVATDGQKAAAELEVYLNHNIVYKVEYADEKKDTQKSSDPA